MNALKILFHCRVFEMTMPFSSKDLLDLLHPEYKRIGNNSSINNKEGGL